MDEYTPDAWEAILAEYALEECLAAVRLIVRYQAFVAPADIVDWISRMRADQRSRVGLFGFGCGQRECDCTHTFPCDRGMVESRDMPGAITWCWRCWPDRAPKEDETREQWVARLQSAKAGA